MCLGKQGKTAQDPGYPAFTWETQRKLLTLGVSRAHPPAAIWGGNQRMEDLALTLPSSETKQRKEKERQLYLSQESVPQVILFSHVYTTVK